MLYSKRLFLNKFKKRCILLFGLLTISSSELQVKIKKGKMSKEKEPICCLVIGMAGSGKSTLMEVKFVVIFYRDWSNIQN